MTGTRVELKLAFFKRKFSISNFILGDKAYIRGARRSTSGTKAKKNRKKESAAEITLGNAVKKGELDSTIKQFRTICTCTKTEYDEYGEALWSVIQTIYAEFERLKKEYEQESDPEAKAIMKQEAKQILKAAERWFGFVQSNDSFNVQLSDDASLRSEVDHLFDNFNLQASVKKVQKEERKIKKLQRPKSNVAQPDAKRREKLRHLNNLVSQFNNELGLEDKAVKDIINIMQIEQMTLERFFEEVFKQLKGLNFPEEHFSLLKKDSDIAKKAARDFYTELGKRMNSLILVLKTIA